MDAAEARTCALVATAVLVWALLRLLPRLRDAARLRAAADDGLPVVCVPGLGGALAPLAALSRAHLAHVLERARADGDSYVMRRLELPFRAWLRGPDSVADNGVADVDLRVAVDAAAPCAVQVVWGPDTLAVRALAAGGSGALKRWRDAAGSRAASSSAAASAPALSSQSFRGDGAPTDADAFATARVGFMPGDALVVEEPRYFAGLALTGQTQGCVRRIALRLRVPLDLLQPPAGAAHARGCVAAPPALCWCAVRGASAGRSLAAIVFARWVPPFAADAAQPASVPATVRGTVAADADGARRADSDADGGSGADAAGGAESPQAIDVSEVLVASYAVLLVGLQAPPAGESGSDGLADGEDGGEMTAGSTGDAVGRDADRGRRRRPGDESSVAADRAAIGGGGDGVGEGEDADEERSAMLPRRRDSRVAIGGSAAQRHPAAVPSPPPLTPPPLSLVADLVAVLPDEAFAVSDVWGAGGATGGGGGSSGGGDDDCVVCLSAPATTALLPCRHWCVCDGCFAHLTVKCPVCRAEFSDVLRVHSLKVD